MDYSLSSYDYPRGYELYVSNDAANWKLVVKGRGQLSSTKISFSQVKARYIRILQTGSGGNYWSIQEMQVYSRE
ncbi:F5/8 type C domain protein [compost metagenome]